MANFHASQVSWRILETLFEIPRTIFCVCGRPSRFHLSAEGFEEFRHGLKNLIGKLQGLECKTYIPRNEPKISINNLMWDILHDSWLAWKLVIYLENLSSDGQDAKNTIQSMGTPLANKNSLESNNSASTTALGFNTNKPCLHLKRIYSQESKNSLGTQMQRDR